MALRVKHSGSSVLDINWQQFTRVRFAYLQSFDFSEINYRSQDRELWKFTAEREQSLLRKTESELH